MSHICHAKNCNTPTNRSMLMCRKHWKMVPPRMKDEVYRHFNPEQCKPNTFLPTKDWLVAARKAINHVAKVEEQRKVKND